MRYRAKFEDNTHAPVEVKDLFVERQGNDYLITLRVPGRSNASIAVNIKQFHKALAVVDKNYPTFELIGEGIKHAPTEE